jgi:hypothetical protein
MRVFYWLCRELAQITVPAGLLSQADGEAIKDLLRKGPVSVALNWTDLMPKASKVGASGRQHQFCLFYCDSLQAARETRKILFAGQLRCVET